MSQSPCSSRLIQSLVLLLLSNLFINSCCSDVDAPNKLEQIISLADGSSSDSEDDYNHFDAPAGFVPLTMKPIYMLELENDPLICHPGNYHLDENVYGYHINCTPETILTPKREEGIQDATDYAIDYLNELLFIREDNVDFSQNFQFSEFKIGNIPYDAYENTNSAAFILARSHGLGNESLAYNTILWPLGVPGPARVSITTFDVSQIKDMYPLQNEDEFRILFTILHELIHGLGFMREWMKIEQIMIRGTKMSVVTSDNVKRVAQEYFNCKTLKGAYLQPSENGLHPSHWYYLMYPQEVMRAGYTPSLVATSLSFAVLADFEWYQVRLPSIPMTTGKNAGCDFAEDLNFEKIPDRCYPEKKTIRCSKDGLFYQECNKIQDNIYVWENYKLCASRYQERKNANEIASCQKNDIKLFQNDPNSYIDFDNTYACYNIHCTGRSTYVTLIGSFYYPCKKNDVFNVHNYPGNFRCNEHMEMCGKYKKQIKQDYWPVLESVTPRGRYGEMIRIKGKNFRTTRPRVICIEKLSCKIIILKSNMIMCKVMPRHHRCKIKDEYIGNREQMGFRAKKDKMNVLYIDEVKEKGNAITDAFELLQPRDTKYKKKQEEIDGKMGEPKLDAKNRRPSKSSSLEKLQGPADKKADSKSPPNYKPSNDSPSNVKPSNIKPPKLR